MLIIINIIILFEKQNYACNLFLPKNICIITGALLTY